MIHKGSLGRRHGFTLIELIVVLVILGILAALAIPTFNAIRNRGAETVALSDATTIARAATGLYALYDGRSGDGTDMACGTTGTEVCDQDDAVENAARESGFTGSPLTKGQTVLTGSNPVWTVTAQEGSDNASVACITFDDQAFTAETEPVTDPDSLPTCAAP